LVVRLTLVGTDAYSDVSLEAMIEVNGSRSYHDNKIPLDCHH
jgi:hypothetical protein